MPVGTWWHRAGFFAVLCSFSLCEDLLIPERPLDRQEIRLGEKKIYRLEQLRSLSSYEVKISYPATFPVSFYIELVDDERSQVRTGRRLLNTEKLEFSTPENVEEFSQHSRIAIEVDWHGITWKQNVTLGQIVYNIHLGRVFNGVPIESFPHIAAVLALVCFFVLATLRNELTWPFSFLISNARDENFKRQD